MVPKEKTFDEPIVTGTKYSRCKPRMAWLIRTYQPADAFVSESDPSGNLVADFVAEVVKTFEKPGESKLLASSATQLNVAIG